MKKTIAPPIDLNSAEYKNLIDLLAVFSDAHNRIQEIETKANGDLLEILDEAKPDYAKNQEAMTKAEAALEIICKKHPEWFVVKQSIKTPYGSVAFRESSSVKAENDEISIVLVKKEIAVLEVELAHAAEEKKAALTLKLNLYKSFLRSKEELNLEALEKCDDAMLQALRLQRHKKENFTVKPATVDMGKAVKEAVEAEQK